MAHYQSASPEIEDSFKIESERVEANPTESESLEEQSHSIRLSKSVVYEPDKAIIYAGITHIPHPQLSH